MIRFAKKTDVNEVVTLLYNCLGKIAEHLTNRKKREEVLEVLTEYFFQDINRLSYKNTIVKELDGKVVGIAVMYHGSKAEKLDTPIIARIQSERKEESFSLDKEAEVDEYYLDTLSVSENYQRKGIGQALMTAFENHAAKQNHEKLSLNVEVENQSAHQLYKKVGYETKLSTTIIGTTYYHMIKIVPTAQPMLQIDVK